MTPPNSDKLPRCRNEQKWSLLDHFGMPKMALLTEEHLANSRMVLDRAPGAWPTLHGHSQVRRPGQSRLPGPMVVAGTIFQQIAMCIVAPPPFLFLFPSSVHCLAFFRRMHSRSHSAAPAHYRHGDGRCTWGPADVARPLPCAASWPRAPPRPKLRVRDGISDFAPRIVLPWPLIQVKF